jgi:hypothetical protein
MYVILLWEKINVQFNLHTYFSQIKPPTLMVSILTTNRLYWLRTHINFITKTNNVIQNSIHTVQPDLNMTYINLITKPDGVKKFKWKTVESGQRNHVILLNTW